MTRVGRARFRPAAVSVAGLLLGACSSSSPGSATGQGSLPPTTPGSTTSTASSSSASSSAQPTHAVWVAQSAGGQTIRAVALSGGGAHTVATIPGDATVMAVGAARVAVAWSDHTIHVINIASGGSATYTGGGDQLLGGAFSPDGTRLAYVIATASPSGGSLRVVDLASHAVTTLRAFGSNLYDSPVVWASDAMAGPVIVGFSDAGPQGAVRLDPGNGARLATSTTTGSTGPQFSSDGLHAGDAVHSALGDEGDAPPGPGPQGPFNTLRAFAIGSTPANVLKEPHHNIGLVALSDDGTAMCWSDDSAAGGFAGISLSNDFGLLLMHNGAKTNLHHLDGSRWDAGVFTHDQSLVIARHSGPTEMLQLFANGHDGVTIDSMPADFGVHVALY